MASRVLPLHHRSRFATFRVSDCWTLCWRKNSSCTSYACDCVKPNNAQVTTYIRCPGKAIYRPMSHLVKRFQCWSHPLQSLHIFHLLTYHSCLMSIFFVTAGQTGNKMSRNYSLHQRQKQNRKLSLSLYDARR